MTKEQFDALMGRMDTQDAAITGIQEQVKAFSVGNQPADPQKQEIKPEDNHITRRYQNLGLKAVNALHSQGILELHAVYCNPKRCLDCLIGNHWLLKKPP